jgi:hypothetical protein
MYGISETAKRLPPALRGRVVGATFAPELGPLEDAFAAMPRGLQIASDVQRRRPRDWLALDDDVIGWPKEHLPRLVQCDPYEGISAPAVLGELKTKLAALCTRNRD